jgi:TPR repeat protein
LLKLSRTTLGVGFAVTLALASGASFAADFADTRAAAQQADASGQSSLGLMYEFGDGVPQDYAEAAKWYRLAAELGDAGGQFNFGVMYYNGNGVPQDYVRAHTWFNLAASRGNANGSKNRDMVAKLMTPAQIAEAQHMAREWKPKPE